MISKEVVVTQVVLVTIDESKFDATFMAEFRASFYPFTTVNDHLEHLAQLFARGLVDDNNDFIEGYGPAKDMGIRFKIVDDSSEISP